MFKLYVIQAAYGECSLLEWGPTEQPQYALIDAGPRETYATHLKPILLATRAWERGLDLAVITHTDSDHVGGLLQLLRDSGPPLPSGRGAPIRIGELWHNSFELTGSLVHDVSPTTPIVTKSIAEGNELVELAHALQIPINTHFESGLVVASEQVYSVAGLRISVIGPTREQLEKLRQAWRTKAWDVSTTNRTGISFVAEAEGRTVMFTGDARGDELLSQLKAGGWLDADTRRHVDVLSVPHHGAVRSNVSSFLSRVTAQMYVISAGDKHDHPGMETLTQILDGQVSQKSERTIFATNETASISAFRRQSLPAQRDALKILAPDSHAFTISLAD